MILETYAKDRKPWNFFCVHFLNSSCAEIECRCFVNSTISIAYIFVTLAHDLPMILDSERRRGLCWKGGERKKQRAFPKAQKIPRLSTVYINVNKYRRRGPIVDDGSKPTERRVVS